MATDAGSSTLGQVIKQHRDELLADWVKEQKTSKAYRNGFIRDDELESQSAEALDLISEATTEGAAHDAAESKAVRDYLTRLSHLRARQGQSPSDTALFVLSLKHPLVQVLARHCGDDLKTLGEMSWSASNLLDQLSMWTMEVYQQERDSIISRQQREMLELSTPVIKLWDGVLALPLIGTLDSERTQVVMETLLQSIVESDCTIAIIDITGVPAVDTRVAQHLLQTVAAARLMGADCIISGIRPQIAQTMVHLGLILGEVVTKANLADAFSLALQKLGLTVQASAGRS